MTDTNIVGHFTAKDFALSPLCERLPKGLGNTKAKHAKNGSSAKLNQGLDVLVVTQKLPLNGWRDETQGLELRIDLYGQANIVCG